MITDFYKSDIEANSYAPLYQKLKKCIGKYECYDEREKVCGVYFIYNDNDELMYIGKSRNLASRITTHIRGKYKNAKRIVLELVEDEFVDDVEIFLINTMKPIDNVMVEQKHKMNEWIENFIEGNIEIYPLATGRTEIYPKVGVVLSSDFMPEIAHALITFSEAHPQDCKALLEHVYKHLPQVEDK